MPNFISALQALVNGNPLSYVNYTEINYNQTEFIRPDLWDAELIKKPSAVYYPGDAIFKARMMTFTGSPSNSVAGITATIRGYTINQKTSRSTNGSVTMTFMDREDQAITVMVEDWKDKIADKDNKYSFRKEDTYCDVKHTIFNTSRIPIRNITYLTCQPNSGEIAEGGTSDAEVSSSLSEVSLVLDFEHYKRLFLNL